MPARRRDHPYHSTMESEWGPDPDPRLQADRFGGPGDGGGVGGFASFDDTDTPAEVIAVWRIQRRVALSYLVVFLIGTLGVGVAIATIPWVTDTTIFNGFSPGFVLAAFGLYLFFLILGAAAASLANGIEHRMMGATSVAETSGVASDG